MVYKRLLILGLLSACLIIFGYPSEGGKALASTSVCYQDCEASRAMCEDSCITECSQTDEDCGDCYMDCAARYERCMHQAIYCIEGTMNYTASCTVGFGQHCPIIAGVVNCDDPSTHNGYYQTCNNGPGGAACVSCPQSQFFVCPGAGSIPSCL